MTGLDKILKHIEEDAVSAAEGCLSEAERKADEIMADAIAESEKICAGIEERSKLDIQSSLSRAESAANLQEKKLILKAKQEIIGEVINNAKESLLKLPDKEYFDVIIRMIQKYALAGAGYILFSDTDYKRLPERFNEIIGNCLIEKAGAALTLTDEKANINGGFILVYGDVEINCSFEALFAAAKDNLQDKVSEVLFD